MDIALNWLALLLAYALKEGGRIGIPTEQFGWNHALITFMGVALTWLVVTALLETYDYKRRLPAEIGNLVAALAITIAFCMTFVFFTRVFVYPRWFVVFYGGLGVVLLAGSRIVKHLVREIFYRRGYFLKRLLIIGHTDVGRRLAKACRETHVLGYDYVGMLAEEREAEREADWLGGLDKLEEVIEEQRIDEIIVALPGREHDRILEIAHRCQGHSVRLRVVPDLFEVVMVRATVTEIDDIPLIGLRDPAISGYQSWIKRTFDMVVALFCVVLFSPLFVIIPILIRRDSGGKVLYVQERAGENGKPFRLYKFRSMVRDADQRLAEVVNVDDLPEPVYKIPDDPRVTRIGRFLRRTSLDELPQLFNVLKGDMSVVGPRPEATEMVDRYNMWQRKRLNVKPGITGPMQVRGRGDMSLDDRIRLELMYISNYSVLNDVKLLIQTVPAVIRGRGAY
jgi:exopolysaccharide biosynthesis polyprenyl glycosylphosphotransferase